MWRLLVVRAVCHVMQDTLWSFCHGVQGILWPVIMCGHQTVFNMHTHALKSYFILLCMRLGVEYRLMAAQV